MQQSMTAILRKLFSRRDKKILLLLMFTAIAISIVETISISAIMVFISIATNFAMFQKSMPTWVAVSPEILLLF